jgi:hypothetical protein
MNMVVGAHPEGSTQGQIRVRVVYAAHDTAGTTHTCPYLHEYTRGLPPSAGGNDISKGMRPIFGIMGLCPQHDLLWGALSGREHLRFYGTLKGMSGVCMGLLTS